MGSCASAELAYGHRLDDGEGTSFYSPVDEYGGLLVPWFDENNPRYRSEDDEDRPAPLEEALVWELYNAIPEDHRPAGSSLHFQRKRAMEKDFGVRLATWGDMTHGVCYGTALVLADPVTETLDGVVDIPDPARIAQLASDPEVAERFDRIHKILGITPHDNNPARWLLLPSYG